MIIGGIAFLVLWWLVFLAVLAMGRSDDKPSPNLLKRFGITTALAAGLWSVFFMIYSSGLVGMGT